MNTIVGGNGQGRRLDKWGEAEGTELAPVVSLIRTGRGTGLVATFGKFGHRHRSFAAGGASIGRSGKMRPAFRRLRDRGEGLEQEERKDDQPGYRSSEHFRNYKLPNSGTATEIPS